MTRTFILAAVLCACGAPQRGEPFDYHLRSYNEAVRWQQFDRAAMNIPVREREDFLDEREQLADDLRVDDVEVKRVRFRHARTWARVDVEYSWHLDSRGIVHKTVVRQVWERHGNDWFVAKETRVRGEPMPGIGESEPEPADEITSGTGLDREITE